MSGSPRSTEILCFCSGKGGAGKTLFASCLGYALTRVGLRVLVIDADPATAGLSLFLLGPAGMRTIEKFTPDNTFSGILDAFRSSGKVQFSPIKIYRNGRQDHGVVYDALISGSGIYGQDTAASTSIPDVDQTTFRDCIAELYRQLRVQGEYDYVIVDTRGGFGFESTDLCGYADSFIIVVEADPTSFYQTRNLVRRINTAAGQSGSKSTLRAFLINKAVDGLTQSGNLDLSRVELSFRNELTREHPVKFESTHPVPADLEVLHSYKEQQVPFLRAPASLFTYATLSAYSEIFQIVTSRWTEEQVQAWQAMANAVSDAIQKRNEEAQEALRKIEADKQEMERLRGVDKERELREHQLKLEIEHLRNEVERATAQARAEYERTTTLGELVKQVSISLPPPPDAAYPMQIDHDIQVRPPIRFRQRGAPDPPAASRAASSGSSEAPDDEGETAMDLGEVAVEAATPLYGALRYAPTSGSTEFAPRSSRYLLVGLVVAVAAILVLVAALLFLRERKPRTAETPAQTASQPSPAETSNVQQAPPPSQPAPADSGGADGLAAQQRAGSVPGKTPRSQPAQGSAPVQSVTSSAQGGQGSAPAASPVPHIYIHVSSTQDRERANLMAAALKRAGFLVSGPDELPYRYPRTELHYYWDDVQTTSDVDSIMGILDKNGFSAAAVRTRQNFPPRDYGLWVAAGSSAPPSRMKP